MAEVKTKQTDADVYEFINAFANSEQKKKDSHELIKFIQKITAYEARMWGPSIIGFGSYHYKSERSRQQGDWPMISFSPRKAAISLYVYCGSKGQDELLKDLGKFKMGKACIYVNKLSDINMEILEKLIISSVEYLKSKYQYDVC